MELQTRNFGTIQCDTKDMLLFPAGLVGMEYLRQFVLLSFDDYAPLKFLQSVDNPAFSFILINPYLLLPDYQIQLSAQDKDELQLIEEGGIFVYSILTMPGNPDRMSANLLAPVIMNLTTMRAKQIIMLNSTYRVNHALVMGEGGLALVV